MFAAYKNAQEDLIPEVPTEHLAFIEYLKNYLAQNYQPVSDPRDSTFNKSTEEVFFSLQGLFPSSQYSAEDVASWLHDAGFTFYDFGEMKFEWLMKEFS